MFKPQYKQLINVDSSVLTCAKADLSLQHHHFVRAFSHRILSSDSECDTDTVASYYCIVPYLHCCYASLAMSNAAHDYWKCYINVVTRTCSGFYWYICTLPRGFTPSGWCIYISQTPPCRVTIYIRKGVGIDQCYRIKETRCGSTPA